MRISLVLGLWLVMLPLTASAQSTPPVQVTPGLELLQRVARHYADAASYRIEGVQEQEFTYVNGLGRQWNKSLFTAAEASGGRRFLESQTQFGRSQEISDGKTVWNVHADEHRYTANPVSVAEAGRKTSLTGVVDMGLMDVRSLKSQLASIAERYKSAELLADETLTIEGQPVLCHVVHAGPADRKRASGSQPEATYWIDARREILIRMRERRTEFSMGGGSVPSRYESTTTYTKTQLDAALDPAQFIFTPGPETRRVDAFPDPMDNIMGDSLVGDPAPSLEFKSADGKTVALESLRGHLVILDFWSTTCGPCVAALPRLAELYAEGKEKGLVLLSIDQDEEPAKCDAFWAKKGYAWPNYHDADGAISARLHVEALPRLTLVDAQGVIQYDGQDESRLREWLAALAPQLQAPKPSVSQTVGAQSAPPEL